MVAILARYASRFSVRALDLTIDSSILWVGLGWPSWPRFCWRLFRGCLPQARRREFGLASGGVRITGSTGRRLQVFAVTQIAASFMLLAGASMLIKTLLTLQATQTGFDMHRVLAMNVPVMSYGKSSDQIINFYREVIRRINEIPGVDRVALGTHVSMARRRWLRPWLLV